MTVALLATFMGICKVKDDNIVQAMQQAQAGKLDHWSFYQARNIRQDVAQAALDGLLASEAAQPAAAQQKRDDRRLGKVVLSALPFIGQSAAAFRASSAR